ncbi:GntR family transcriptional regulator [Temperatibacter marinus]|uniref:GntR family transcriptional regulator n=1 Tax=Temperatibacter marinus TaxID=1456591 RepID=A0AA52EK83_9PROT|nr:GntR family transcriptional regulator [Temperatibacter marinus]WND03551.1 GntR family transcriptional regulator [Temperatibacter marinus]
MERLTSIFGEYQRDALKQDTRTPLYHQLYIFLKNSILNGTFAHNTQMPTEAQLSEYFDVSRITAKRAMDELTADGLVERRRGRGTRVIYDYEPQPLQAPLVGMLQEIESMARHSDAQVISCQDLAPPSNIRALLQLDESEEALYVLRVRHRDGMPFGHYVSWTAGMNEKTVCSELEHTPRLDLFRKQGLNISHISQTISAVAANAKVAALLKVEEGHPLLSLERHSFVMVGGKEKLVDVLQILYHPDHFQYQMDLKMDN